MTFSRILAVKLADFGDALCTTPALRAIRTTFPRADLDVLTTPAAATVYSRSGLADEVLVFEKRPFDRPSALAARPAGPLRLARDLRAGGYEAVVLFHHLTTRYGALKHAALVLATGAEVRVGLERPGSRRGWFLTHKALDLGFDARHEVLTALAVASALGATTDDLSLAFEPGQDAKQSASHLLSRLAGRGPVVAIHPGSGDFGPARRWPAARFAEVADALAATGTEQVLVGSSVDPTEEVLEHAQSDLLDLSGRTDLQTLAAVLASCDLLVCNDSGVMHLATAMDTPVVAAFGPSNEVAWGPWHHSAGASSTDPPHRLPHRSPHRVVALDLSCRPCFYTGYDLGSRFGCPTRDCLSWLSSGRVVAAALETLQAS